MPLEYEVPAATRLVGASPRYQLYPTRDGKYVCIVAGSDANFSRLCKAMDRVAATYAGEAKKAGKDVKPTATPACADPGPFAYTPPDQKPLEAAGAHSPPGTAATPPSGKTPAAEQKPAAVKKS